MLILQPNRHPLEWKGYLSPSGFQFWLDYHLCHLANSSAIGYDLYCATELPRWQFAEIYDPQFVEPGGFLIYRPSDFEDDECLGIADLIGRLHDAMSAVAPKYTYHGDVEG
jgi:hypothetical protein